jgi:hypothetical protein
MNIWCSWRLARLLMLLQLFLGLKLVLARRALDHVPLPCEDRLGVECLHSGAELVTGNWDPLTDEHILDVADLLLECVDGLAICRVLVLEF